MAEASFITIKFESSVEMPDLGKNALTHTKTCLQEPLKLLLVMIAK